MRIKKIVITAAGSGSRLLPFSKEIPKEMMPIYARSKGGRPILKPILQEIYESLYDHGCRDFCFVVGREKRAIEDYFTTDRLARHSSNADLQELYEKLDSSRITYAKQPAPNGFGDAVLQARMFAEEHAFLLHAGDDAILSPGNDHITRLENAFFAHDADVAFLTEKVQDPRSYGVVEGERIDRGLIRVDQIEEKPSHPKTDQAVVAVYIFKPLIFALLERAKPDKAGEVQLTDSINTLLKGGKGIAVELEPGETRLDIGTPQKYIKGINDSFGRV